MLQRNCLQCAKVFLTKPSQVKYGLGKFCSRECSSLYQRRGEEKACYICQKIIWRRPRSIAHSKSGLFFCSKVCQASWKNSIFKAGYLSLNWRGGKSSYRDRAIKKFGLKCSKGDQCPLKNINLPSYVLDVDHINSNREDNRLENLQILCVWCHRVKNIEKLKMVVGDRKLVARL